MKKLINLFFLLLSLTTMSLISCSKNEIENDDYVIPGEDSELYKKVANELHDYLYTHENATIEDLQEQLTNYSTQITSEVISDILFVYIDSLTFVCDPYCKTAIQKQEGDNQAIIDFIKEMNDALYPEGALCRDSKKSDDFETSLQMGKTRGSRSSSTNKVLTKEKVMYWDPYWKPENKSDSINNNESDLMTKYESDLIKRKGSDLMTDWGNYINTPGKNISLVPYLGENAKLNKLKDFDEYDVVYMSCHGDPKGNIYIPSRNKKSIFNLLFDRGEETKELDLVSVEELKKNLPSDMSKTVLWTAICWSDLSHLKQIALERNCVAFSGPDNWCKTGVTEIPFICLINAFYQPSSIYAAARLGLFEECEYIEGDDKWHFYEGRGGQVSFGEGRTIRISMRYKNMHYTDPMHPEEGEKIVDGNYIVTINDALTQTKNVILPQRTQNDQPRADITMTYNQFESIFESREDTRTTRELSNDGYSMGFWVRNKETKEETEIAISDSTVVIYANGDNPKYFPKDYNQSKEIVRVEVLGKTDKLEPGTYEYRTYHEIDGEKEYSDSIYVFTVKEGSSCPDDNHPHAIDLGLPSGNKWSCCDYVYYLKDDYNVIYGQYRNFAWGSKTWLYGLYEFGFATMDPLSGSYIFSGNKPYTYIGDEISCTNYDIVFTNWNNGWCMPTANDYKELMSECHLSFEIDPDTNILYAKYSGPNRNYIKRALGEKHDREIEYWTGTLNTESIDDDYPNARLFAHSYRLVFKEGEISHYISSDLRQNQHFIWPVRKN